MGEREPQGQLPPEETEHTILEAGDEAIRTGSKDLSFSIPMSDGTQTVVRLGRRKRWTEKDVRGVIHQVPDVLEHFEAFKRLREEGLLPGDQETPKSE